MGAALVVVLAIQWILAQSNTGADAGGGDQMNCPRAEEREPMTDRVNGIIEELMALEEATVITRPGEREILPFACISADLRDRAVAQLRASRAEAEHDVVDGAIAMIEFVTGPTGGWTRAPKDIVEALRALAGGQSSAGLYKYIWISNELVAELTRDWSRPVQCKIDVERPYGRLELIFRSLPAAEPDLRTALEVALRDAERCELYLAEKGEPCDGGPDCGRCLDNQLDALLPVVVAEVERARRGTDYAGQVRL